MGNRQWVDVGGNNTTYTVDADTNRYTQWGSSNATYDYLGSMVEAGEWNYSYDKENRLTGASTNATTASYTYDAFGRRIEKSVNGTVTKFVYSGDQIVAEYDGNDILLRKYVYGPGIDEPLAMITANNTSYYYHADGLGSVSEVSDANRAVVESYSYDVYGEMQIRDSSQQVINTSAIGNRYGFTGREYDAESGLYHYRARSYSPEVGRFMQRDPVGYRAGINLYVYCGNNPLNWVDPKGDSVRIPGWMEQPLWPLSDVLVSTIQNKGDDGKYDPWWDPSWDPGEDFSFPAQHNGEEEVIPESYDPTPAEPVSEGIPVSESNPADLNGDGRVDKWDWWVWFWYRRFWDLMSPPGTPYPPGYGSDGPGSNDPVWGEPPDPT